MAESLRTLRLVLQEVKNHKTGTFNSRIAILVNLQISTGILTSLSRNLSLNKCENWLIQE